MSSLSLVLRSTQLLTSEELGKCWRSESGRMNPGWSLETWLDLKTRSGYFLAQLGPTHSYDAMALVTCLEVDDPVHLLKIWVSEDLQGKGQAKELLQKLCFKVAEDGFQKLYLEVRETNQRAIAFYQRLGFESLVVKPRFYSDGGSAVAMQKLLMCGTLA